MFIKLCGFTRTEDVEILRTLQISAGGFIFYKNSRRYVTPERAREMSLLLHDFGIKAAGVFVDDSPEEIMEIAGFSHLDMIQVYNSNTAIELSPQIPVINCVRLGGPEQHQLPEPHEGGMVLFDTYSAEAHGGTGRTFDPELIKDYPFKDQMIIAGGITSENVKNIITELRPGGIDISSGIEISPGIKSEEKILRILKAIKEAANDINA